MNAVERVERDRFPWFTLRKGAFLVLPKDIPLRPGAVIRVDPDDVQIIPPVDVPWVVAWDIVEQNAC